MAMSDATLSAGNSTLSDATLKLFEEKGLEIREVEKKGRGVIAKRDFKCGDVLLQDKGWVAKDMEKLASLILASEEGRAAVAHMYAGPLHHLQGVQAEEQTPEWMDMYSKVRYNSFQLEGSVLLPHMGLFNHSCKPNIAMVQVEPLSEGVAVMLVVAKDGIAAGQDCVLCYDSELMFTRFRPRQRQLMTAWNFMCQCDLCVTERAQEDSGGEQPPDDDDEDQLKLLTDASPERLQDLPLFNWRREVMHQQGLPFKVRREMFSVQLAAACSILPCLHPAIRGLYEQLKDLCNSSEHKDHCERVCQFHEALCKEGQATWDAGAVISSTESC